MTPPVRTTALAARPRRSGRPTAPPCSRNLSQLHDHHAVAAQLASVVGQPSAAAVTLLRQAHSQGVPLYYHGDSDWGGLRIAAGLLRHVPWRPWRYSADDYRPAAAGSGGPRLEGTPAPSDWEPGLALALAEFGVRVEEEAVLDELLADLAPARHGGPGVER